MQFFIDTANIEEIRQANSWGIVDGVTTNPSLIAKEGRDFKKVVQEICAIVDGPISAEVISLDAKGMVSEGLELAKIHKNVIIKVPMTYEGIKAVKEFGKKGIRTNVTLCFSANQALIAGKAGATYVSPFVGRLDDNAETGMKLIEEIVTIFSNYDIKTKILVASVRHPIHVKEAALLGADVATMPFKVMKQLIEHPLTERGIAMFLKDWEGARKK